MVDCGAGRLTTAGNAGDVAPVRPGLVVHPEAGLRGPFLPEPLVERQPAGGRPSLRDPRDEFILELAVTAGCHAIVTHNVRDFVEARRFRVGILTPAAFLGRLEEP